MPKDPLIETHYPAFSLRSAYCTPLQADYSDIVQAFSGLIFSVFTQ